MRNTLPNLIVIGAMKAGTTSLHNYLNEHPQIYLSKRKELNFFIKERNYSKGIDWYKRQFNSDYKINGYASPDYTKKHIYKKVPERMSAILPNVRLIYLVRDPIDRFVSHYHHVRMNNLVKKPIDALFDNLEENDCYRTSLYYYQIREYLNYFSRSQILIIPSEQLLHKRKQTMKRIFRFIGVEADLDLNFDYKTHVTSKRGVKPKIISRLLRTEFGEKFKAFVPKSLSNGIAKVVEKKIPYPHLTLKQKEILAVKFQKDIKLLEDEWNLTLDWETYRNNVC